MHGKGKFRRRCDTRRRLASFAALGVFGWLASTSIAASFPTIKDSAPEVILFSWKHGRSYHFALVRPNERAEFVKHFSASDVRIVGVSNLKKAMLHVPRNTTIVWRDDLRYGIVFPPSGVVDDVKRFAINRGIDLQIIPSIYD